MNSNICQSDARFPEVPFSPDQYKHSVNPPLQLAKSLSDTNEQATKMTVHEKKERTEKNKSKRDSSSEFVNNKTVSAKRSKGAEEAEVMSYRGSKDGAHLVNSQHSFPKKSWQDQFKSNNADIETQDYSLANHSRSVTFGNTHKIHQNPEFWSLPRVDVQKPGSRTCDTSAQSKFIDRSNKNTEQMVVRSDNMSDDKLFKNTLDETGFGEKPLTLPEFNRKSDHDGHLKDNGQASQIRKSDRKRSRVISVKGAVYRRELSELELGEFREPSTGSKPPGVRRQSQGKSFFKPSENKAASVISSDLDVSRINSSCLHLESRQQSPHNLRGGNHGNQKGFHQKMLPDDPVDTARVLQRTIPSQGQQHFRADDSQEVKSHLDNMAELAHRGEMVTSQRICLENSVCSLNKNSAIMPSLLDIKRDSQNDYKNAKDSKQRKPNKLEDSTDRNNNNISVEADTTERERREAAIEDDNPFYAKHDKEIPGLRKSIRDRTQYNDYVKEYHEKYESMTVTLP